MHAIIALDKWVAKIVDAEFLQTLQRPIVEVQIVGIPEKWDALILKL